MMISIEKSVGRPTCTVASWITAAIDCRSRGPEWWESRRKIFSTTITAPSTMMPKSIAPSDRRLAGMPRSLSPTNVLRSESGMMSATIPAERKLPRNR